MIKQIKIGKKYTATRRNGETVTSKAIEVKGSGRGLWATIEYAVEGSKTKRTLTQRPSQLTPA